MKRLISVCLALVLLLMANSNVVLANDCDVGLILSNCTLEGVPISNSAWVSEINDSKYEFCIKRLRHENNILFLSSELFFNGEKIVSFDSKGYAFFTNAPLSRKTEKTTVMLQTTNCNNIAILNFSLSFSPDYDMMTKSVRMEDGVVIEIAVQYDNSIIYFEVTTSLSENLKTIQQAQISTRSETEELCEFARTADVPGMLQENDSLDEWVQSSEFWSTLYTSEDLPKYNADILSNSDSDFSAFSLSIPSELHGIPETVYTTVGEWESVNNPNHQTFGYKAVTTSWGSNGYRKIRLIKWEYLFNVSESLPSGLCDLSGNTAGIKILANGEYVYRSDTKQVEYAGDYSYMRIQNFAVAIGLMSNENILTQAVSYLTAGGNSVSINWLEWIGFIQNQYFQAAATILNSIEYKSMSHSDACAVYQNTYAKQISTYGKPIKGRKVSCDTKQLSKTGDSLYLSYTITSPTDLPRTGGTKKVAHRFYFNVYERNGSGVYTKTYTVEQIRENGFYTYI